MESGVISRLGLLFGFYGSGEARSLAFRQRSASRGGKALKTPPRFRWEEERSDDGPRL